MLNRINRVQRILLFILSNNFLFIFGYILSDKIWKFFLSSDLFRGQFFHVFFREVLVGEVIFPPVHFSEFRQKFLRKKLLIPNFFILDFFVYILIKSFRSLILSEGSHNKIINQAVRLRPADFYLPINHRLTWLASGINSLNTMILLKKGYLLSS